MQPSADAIFSISPMLSPDKLEVKYHISLIGSYTVKEYIIFTWQSLQITKYSNERVPCSQGKV